jgi:hypothetical protein
MRTQRYSIRLTAAFAMIAAAAIGTGTLARTQEAAHHYAGVTGLPTAYFHPNVLYFKVGTMSSQTTTLTNTSAETLKIRSFSLEGQLPDFFLTTTCGFSLAAGASCAVTLTGMPPAKGPVGKLVESDNSAAGFHYVLLQGTR